MANEVVKYSNKFNTIIFKGFTDNELSLLMTICSKLRGKGTDQIELSFDQIKKLTKEKQHYTNKAYAEMIDNMYQKIIRLSYFYNDGVDVAGAFNLFQGYERSITDESVKIAVTPQFLYLFNSLEREFTRFELEEFVDLSGKYTKLLYRQLKQWRSVGHYSVLLKEFRELMDVPDSYPTRDITKRIIVPSINKLLKLRDFHSLTFKYSYKGKKVVRVIFDWIPESIPKKSESDTSTKLPVIDTAALLREKQRSDPASYVLEELTEEVPGFPGWKLHPADNTEDDYDSLYSAL